MPRPRKPRIDFELQALVLERRELWEGVADTLRGAIVSGGIPSGSNLVEADLADRFGVSRGPVRAALRELDREGLVVDLPRREDRRLDSDLLQHAFLLCQAAAARSIDLAASSARSRR